MEVKTDSPCTGQNSTLTGKNYLYIAYYIFSEPDIFSNESMLRTPVYFHCNYSFPDSNILAGTNGLAAGYKFPE
jgi:hypothetical protein